MSRAIATLATRQHGNVARKQLLALGLGSRAIEYRTTSGYLHRVHTGVYAVGRPASTPLERACAAALAGGPEALLSHRAGLALWGWGSWPAKMEITRAGELRIPGVISHRSRTLARTDRRRHLSIPVTSPARTLLDCTPLLGDPPLTRAVNDALRSGLLRAHELEALLRRCGTRPGAGRLARIAGVAAQGPTRSQLEDLFLAFCERHALPTPQMNVKLDGFEVDAYFSRANLIVELDGWAFHRDRRQFELDRERDAHALACGRPTVRITAARLEASPAQEAARLRKIIESRW